MQSNEYVIDHLGAASYLAAKGLKLLGAVWSPTKRGIVQFRFDDSEHRAAALIGEFFTDGTVVAREFDVQLAKLKGIIWEHVHPEAKRKLYGRDIAPVTPNYFSGDGGAR